MTKAQPDLWEGSPRSKQGPEEKDVQASSAPQEPEHDKRQESREMGSGRSLARQVFVTCLKGK